MVNAEAEGEKEDKAPSGLDVELAFSREPRDLVWLRLRLPAGSTVADALRASAVPQVIEWLELQSRSAAPPRDDFTVSVWSRPCALSHPLRPHDRIDLCRPLSIDPKEARRQRHVRSKPPR